MDANHDSCDDPAPKHSEEDTTRSSSEPALNSPSDVLCEDELTAVGHSHPPPSPPNQKVCVVCMERLRSTSLPCGHQILCIDCANSLLQNEQPCPSCRAKFDTFVVGTSLGRKNSFERLNSLLCLSVTQCNEPNVETSQTFVLDVLSELPAFESQQPQPLVPPPPPAAPPFQTLTIQPATPNEVPRLAIPLAPSVCTATSCCFCIPLRISHRILVICDVAWMAIGVLGMIVYLARYHSVNAAMLCVLLCKVLVARFGVLSALSRSPQNRILNKRRHLWAWILRCFAVFLVMIFTAALGARRVGTQIEFEVETCRANQETAQSSVADTCNGDLSNIAVVLLMLFSPLVTDGVCLLLPGIIVQMYFIVVLRSNLMFETNRTLPRSVVSPHALA